ANKPAIKILPFEGQDEATAAVVSKKADGMLADSPVGAYAVKQSGGSLMPVGDIYDSAPYGYVLPKDQTEFGAAIAVALTDLKASGDYDRILDGWGVKDGGLTAFAMNP
ncbi:MAG: ABC transporter substrate-binding protein, partial [Angustibacter sp.]